MPSPFWIRAVVWLAVVFAAITAIARGLVVDTTTLAIVAGEVSLIVVVLNLFDRVLWRFPPFRCLPWPGRPPILRGTWRMRFTIDPSDESSEEQVVGECYLTIKQTSSQLRARTLFGDGRSRSMLAAITREEDETTLWFFYDFRPEAGTARLGGATLRVLDEPVALLGTYWNELGEHGELESTRHSHRVYNEFARAAKATEETGP